MQTAEKRKMALPSYHDASGRWSQKIGYKHGRNGDRTRAWFYWSGEPAKFPPAEIVAESVAKQNEWAKIVEEWDHLRPLLEELDPDADWSLPVWFDRSMLATPLDAADELKAARQVVADYAAKEAVTDLAKVGDTFHNHEAILTSLRAAGLLPKGLAVATKKLTFKQAVDAYLDSQRQRIDLKAGARITTGTYNTSRNNLLLCIGCNIAKDWQQVTPLIDLTKPLVAIDSADLQKIATHWFKLPGGVSRRTVKNYFGGLRAFLNWCDLQDELGFTKPKATEKVLHINEVEAAEVTPVNYKLLKKVIADQSDRVKMYAMLELLCGFYNADIANLAAAEVETVESETFITGYRSKEDAESKTKSKIKTTHWIPTEVADLMKANKAKANQWGLYFLNRYGQPMAWEKAEGGKVNAVGKAWEKVKEEHADAPDLKQLRKWGWNEIQQHGTDKVCRGEMLAKRWAGQQGGGVAKAYRFDDYRPVIAAQKKWWKAIKSQLGF